MKNQWWGYLHNSGSIHARRFFSQLDIDEAGESPFVKDFFGPFEANSNEEATTILKKQFTVEKIF